MGKYTVAQRDSIVFMMKPQHEIGILFSGGIFSPNKYVNENGRSLFEPYYNRSFGYQFMYSQYFETTIKTSIGIGVYALENTHLINFDKNDIPGMEKYYVTGKFNSATYDLFSRSLDYTFFTFLFHAEKQLLPNAKRNELWVFGGVDLVLLPHNDIASNYNMSIDTAEFILLSVQSVNNPKRGFNPTAEVGAYYSFCMAPSHKLRIGFRMRLSFKNQIDGVYSFFPDDLALMSSGSFTNKMSYVGIDFGYSINNRFVIRRKSELYLDK